MKSDQLAEDLGVTTNTATSTTRRYFMPLSGWDAADWIPERPAWQADAACRGLHGTINFYPERGEDPRPARAVCAECPVRLDCLEYALATGEKNGTWGGLGERERRRIRRQRAAAARLDPPTWHGTRTGYVNHCCRCDLCTAAHSAYIRRYRQGQAS